MPVKVANVHDVAFVCGGLLVEAAVVAKKRGNGEGSITCRKNGGWCALYVVYTAEGRKRKTVYGKTRQEVATKLAQALSDRENGLTFDAGKMTVGEYLDRWLTDCVRGTVRPSTFERHEQIVRVHVKPTLGRIGLKNLTSAHVRGLITEKLETGLAPATVRKLHSTLCKALSQSVSDGLVPRNAAADLVSSRCMHALRDRRCGLPDSSRRPNVALTWQR